MLRDHCIFCWRKTEGRIGFDMICFKLYQLERITRCCLFVLESTMESTMKCVMENALQSILLKKEKKRINFKIGRP